MAGSRGCRCLAALSSDRGKSSAWAAAFCGLLQNSGALVSHTLAKQVYWLVGEDPAKDAHFHLLAPLYPSSLAQNVYERIQEDRFGEESKQARKARKENIWHGEELREYPHLAEQKLGGTKPQNISQLNSERRGVNYLLASLPPIWKSRSLRPPRGNSLFKAFERRKEAGRLLRALQTFLEATPRPNESARDCRDDLVEQLFGEFLDYTAVLRTLPPGWNKEAGCSLPQVEKDWLDPQADASTDPWPEICVRFADWLNYRLEKNLPVGRVEHAFWVDSLKKLLKEYAHG